MTNTFEDTHAAAMMLRESLSGCNADIIIRIVCSFAEAKMTADEAKEFAHKLNVISWKKE